MTICLVIFDLKEFKFDLEWQFGPKLYVFGKKKVF